MKIEAGQKITLDGQTLVAREVFRAGGTTWVRYVITGKRTCDESRYATREEWLEWFFRQSPSEQQQQEFGVV